MRPDHDARFERAVLPVPDEVIRHFTGKTLKPSFAWQDVYAQEHAFAAAVAKATHVDVMTAINEEMEKAIAGFRTLDEFRADLEPRLKALGWWGEGRVEDPRTGRMTPGRLGSPWRLRTIYEANMASARAAGEWQRIERRKQLLPYLLYARTSSKDPRPEHLGWVGTILPVDHPFWRTHYPPNGWRCKCRVEQIGRVEAKARGYDPDAPAPKVERVPFRNRRTGRTAMVPAGIDPGWEHNPGRTRARVLRKALADKLSVAPPHIAKALVHDLLAQPEFVDLMRRSRALGEAGHVRWTSEAVPIGIAPAEIVDVIGGWVIDPKEGRKNRAVWLTDRTFGHKVDRTHPAGASEWAVVQALLDSKDRRVSETPDGMPKVTIMGKVEGETWFMVLGPDDARNKLLVWTLFRPPKPDNYRRRAHDPGRLF